MKFTEALLEQAFINLLQNQGHPYVPGDSISRSLEDVLIKEDIQAFLLVQYKKEGITATEVESIIKDLQKLPSLDLYDSNKTFLNRVRDGFVLKREDRTQKNLFVQLINFEDSKRTLSKC